jgi:hypothetical protein
MYQINMSRCVSNIYMFTVIRIVPYGVRQTVLRASGNPLLYYRSVLSEKVKKHRTKIKILGIHLKKTLVYAGRKVPAAVTRINAN